MCVVFFNVTGHYKQIPPVVSYDEPLVRCGKTLQRLCLCV